MQPQVQNIRVSEHSSNPSPKEGVKREIQKPVTQQRDLKNERAKALAHLRELLEAAKNE